MKQEIKEHLINWSHLNDRCVLYLYGSSGNDSSGKVSVIFTTESDALHRVNSKDTDYNGYSRIVYKDNSSRDFYRG